MDKNGFLEEVNEAYYNSDAPIISDNEFSLVCPEDIGLAMKSRYNKTDHYSTMGSLKKIKTEREFDNWKGNSAVIVTPKLDGNSIELIYENGKLIKAVTRGDGYVGTDITDKIIYTNFPTISIYSSDSIVSVKCEALMLKKYQNDYEKNIRNVVSGLLNSKEININELKKIDVIAFSNYMLTSNYLEQKTFDNTCDFNKLEDVFKAYKQNYEYEIDGLVVELKNKKHEENDPLLPANTVALKFNKTGVEAEIGKVYWHLGKYGRLTPVLKLKEPVIIDGSSVQNVSASNYGLLKETGVNVGAKVKVIKSGDIIPFITEVTEKSDYNLSVPYCPQCNSKADISENGIHAICSNCKNDGLTHLKHIFNIFDLEYISNTTVETLFNNEFINLESIFSLKDNTKCLESIPGIGKSKAANISSKLKSIKLSEAQVLECSMVQGLGNKQCQKLIDHFSGIDNFLNFDYLSEDIMKINGFGKKLSETITSNENRTRFIDTYTILNKHCEIEKSTTKNENNGNIVFTGKYNKMNRKELFDYLKNEGWNIQSGVTKETDLLLTDDPNSGSSKTEKAKKLGIEIKTYREFLT